MTDIAPFEKIMRVLDLISPLREKVRKTHIGVQQVVKCPCCLAEDALWFSISARKAVAMGKCKTEGCVSWIE